MILLIEVGQDFAAKKSCRQFRNICRGSIFTLLGEKYPNSDAIYVKFILNADTFTCLEKKLIFSA